MKCDRCHKRFSYKLIDIVFPTTQQHYYYCDNCTDYVEKLQKGMQNLRDWIASL